MTEPWKTLFLTTLQSPAEAAQQVLGLDINRSQLWISVLAVSALSAFFTGLTILLLPLPAGWPTLFTQPLAHFVTAAGGLTLFAYVVTWVGRILGGTGALDDVLRLVVWLQVVRVGLQIVGLLLLIAVPTLGAFFGLATGLLSLWILLHFIRAGHQLASMGAAAMVLFLSFVGMIVALSILLSFIGIDAIGVQANV